MSLTLTIGDQNLAIDQLKDLSSLVTQNGASDTIFELLSLVLGPPDQVIDDFGELDKDISLKYQSNAQKWNLDGGVFTFGISGGAVGTVHVYSPGKALFSYTPTLPALNGFNATTAKSNTQPFNVPNGKYCVGISLQLSLDVNAGGSGKIGLVGIKGSADASGTYTFSYFKVVDSNTRTRDALTAAFKSFTLPLNENTFTNLSVGDSILHNFKADLKLGMGVSYGIQTPAVAQNIKATLPALPAGLPSANLQANPSAGLNVSLTASFEYTGAFEAYMWKESDVLGRYHLYRSRTLDTSFGIDLNASLISNASVTVNGGNLTQAVSSAISGNTGQTIAQLVAQNTTAQASIDSAAKDINTSITNVLKPIQSVKAELQASIETIDTKAVLLNLSIDLTKVGFSLSAWEHIAEGDFVSALEQNHSGITVDAGSGLEQLHHQKADLKFTFFNFVGEWSTTRINDYSITYGGNNSLVFANMVGIDTITNINKSGKEVQFYFTTALSVNEAGDISVQDPDLHVNLKSTSNPKFGVEIAKFLSLVATGPAANESFNQMKSIANSGSAVIELDLVFKPSAYQKVPFSPNPLRAAADEELDKTNFATFARAVWNFNDDVSNIPDFSYRSNLDLTYDVWKTVNNYLAHGEPLPANALPDRRQVPLAGQMSIIQAGIEAALNSTDISASDFIYIGYTLTVGSSFMNLCQDVQGIGVNPTVGAGNPLAAAKAAWGKLNSEVGYILKQDVDGSYLVPTACALAQLVTAAGATMTYSGPALPTAQDPGYKLTVELS
jgi:hypothetical protein